MDNYCNQCNCCKSCMYNNCKQNINELDFICEQNDECIKYKEKVAGIYEKVNYIQQDVQRSIYESKQLEQQARELERKSKELYAQSKMAYDDACKLEAESHNLLDLASFYCQKIHECYKNLNCKTNYNECCEKNYKCNQKYKNEYNGGRISNTACRCTSNNKDECFNE